MKNVKNSAKIILKKKNKCKDFHFTRKNDAKNEKNSKKAGIFCWIKFASWEGNNFKISGFGQNPGKKIELDKKVYKW